MPNIAKTSKILTFDSIELNTHYLAKYRFNSKKITWQLVKFTNLVPDENGNLTGYFPVIGKTQRVYANDRVFAYYDQTVSLKPVPKNWINKQKVTLQNEIGLLQEQLFKLTIILVNH